MARSGFGFRLVLAAILLSLSLSALAQSLHPKAVVIVDMQTGFLPIASGEGFEAVEPLTNEVLALLLWAKNNEVPVIQFEYQGGGTTITPLQQALNQMQNVVRLTKNNDDGFVSEAGDNAEEALRRFGTQTLIIAGVNSHFCVLSTTMGAIRRSFKVQSAPRLVADFSLHPHHYPDSDWWQEAPTTGFTGFSSLAFLLQAP